MRWKASGYDDGRGGVGRAEGAGLMRKSRYSTIQTPTWSCPYSGYVHYPADLVRLDNERLECCQCGQAVHAGDEG